MQDITLDNPVDGTFQLEQVFLNKNLRDAMMLLVMPPTCILQKVGTQSMAGGNVWTAISWDTKNADTEDPALPIFSAGSPTRMTCRTNGWYEITVNCPMSFDVAGNCFTLAFRVNGNVALIYGGDSEGAANITTNYALSFSTIISMVATDYVEVVFRMSRVAALTSTNFANAPRVAFRRVRGA